MGKFAIQVLCHQRLGCRSLPRLATTMTHQYERLDADAPELEFRCERNTKAAEHSYLFRLQHF